MKIMGIPVVFDPRLTQMPAVSRGFWPLKRIVVGPQWYELTPEARVSVLFHEVHHCLAFHLEVRLAILPLLFIAPRFTRRICREQELACDRFAASQGWGLELARLLEQLHDLPESDFYPTCIERARTLRAHLEDPCSNP